MDDIKNFQQKLSLLEKDLSDSLKALSDLTKNSEQQSIELSRAQYILDGSGLGSWDWWLDSNRVHFDKRWSEMLGLDPAQTPQVLSTWDNLVHPDDKAKAYEDIKAYLDGKTNVYENIHRMKHADGRWVWILDRGRISEHDSNGKPLRFTGTHLDISEYKEKESLSNLVQDIGEIGAWELDVQTGKTRWSKQTYLIHALDEGMPTDKIQGINYFASNEQDRISKYVMDSFSGKSFRDTFEFIDANGKAKWVESVGLPVFNSEEKVYKVVGTFRDVTEEKKVTLRLQKLLDENRQISERMSAVLEHAPIISYECLHDQNWTMLYLSPYVKNITGYPAEDFLTNKVTFGNIIHKDDQAYVYESIAQAVKNGEVFDLEYRIFHASGSVRFISERGQISDKTGNLVGVMLDITKKVEADQLLESQRLQLIRSSKLSSLGEMSAWIAHEINNPLMVISGSASLLVKFSDNPEKWMSAVEKIKKSSDRIARIVSGLKKFSRTDEKKNLKNHNLVDIIKESLILVDPKSKQNATSILIDIQAVPSIVCDEVEIEQVLVNLISNAIDATMNSAEKWVKISLFQQANQVVLQVLDSGPGIPIDIRDKIFNPFFTTKKIGLGTGLGLSIVKGILDEHNASITLRSEMKNTCFEIRFPVSSES